MIASARSPARAAASETFCNSFLATSAWPISMAAAPIASNTTIKMAVITATAPRELFSGNVTYFMTFLLMTHHRLCVNNQRIRNTRHRWDIGNHKVIGILRMHGQGSRTRPTGSDCREGHVREIDSRTCKVVVGYCYYLSCRQLWRPLSNPCSRAFPRRIRHDFTPIHDHAEFYDREEYRQEHRQEERKFCSNGTSFVLLSHWSHFS